MSTAGNEHPGPLGGLGFPLGLSDSLLAQPRGSEAASHLGTPPVSLSSPGHIILPSFKLFQPRWLHDALEFLMLSSNHLHLNVVLYQFISLL